MLNYNHNETDLACYLYGWFDKIENELGRYIK